MLNKFEVATSFHKDKDKDCLKQLQSFTRKEGNVQCIKHIINLAVQDVLTYFKAILSDISKTYQMDANKA